MAVLGNDSLVVALNSLNIYISVNSLLFLNIRGSQFFMV